MDRCVVCKRVLKEEETVICSRYDCKNMHLTKQRLHGRIEVFATFFAENRPTEENYKKYLELIGYEERYLKSVGVDELGNPKMSRRIWFTCNIAQVHKEWPDEFGRYFGEQENA